MTDFAGPIADSLEALASRLRKAGRVLLDQINDLKQENADLVADNSRLQEALDLLRPAHHTPYADEDHQGGNCADIVMTLLSELHGVRVERKVSKGTTYAVIVEVPLHAADMALFRAVADAAHAWEPSDRDGWDAVVRTQLSNESEVAS